MPPLWAPGVEPPKTEKQVMLEHLEEALDHQIAAAMATLGMMRDMGKRHARTISDNGKPPVVISAEIVRG